MFYHPYIARELARGRQRELLARAARQTAPSRHHRGAFRRRGQFAALAAALGAAFLLTACSPAPAPPAPTQAHAPAVTAHGNPVTTATGQASLVGDWLGPMPGDAGECGESYGEWFLHATGSYTFTTNSSDCGGFTNYGSYQVSGNVIDFRQQGVANCATCEQQAAFAVTYRFVTENTLELCDNVRCYDYYRQ
jgi:hypothetical protein